MLHILKALKDYIWSPPIEDDLQERMRRCQEELGLTDETQIGEQDEFNKENFFNCVKAIGKIDIFKSHDGFIDGMHFSADIQRPTNVKSGDTVEYLYYKQSEKHNSRIVEIQSVVDPFSNLEDLYKEKVGYEVGHEIVIGKVVERFQREVVLSEKNIRFHLDSVSTNFLPIVGDWLECHVKAQLLEDTGNLVDDPVGAILEVNEIRSLRNLTAEGRVTKWAEDMGVGVIDESIFFIKDSCDTGYRPQVMDKIAVDAIESDQGVYTWRAISVSFIKSNNTAPERQNTRVNNTSDNNRGVYVTENLCFGTMTMGEVKNLTVEVHNRGPTSHILLRSSFHSKRSESQLKMTNGNSNFGALKPGMKTEFTFECCPVFLGYSEELFVFIFKNFTIRRIFKIYVVDKTWSASPWDGTIQRDSSHVRYCKNLEGIKEKENMRLIRGVKILKSPNFIAVRFPSYNIPPNIWNCVYKYFEEEHSTNSLLQFQQSIPCLMQHLCLDNYSVKFHTLLYLEEVDNILRLKNYDMEKAYLIQDGNYLSLEVEGLAEKRPSLIMGDSVKVSGFAEGRGQLYEGIIHNISGNKIFMKFSPHFHQKYNGEDLKVCFTCGRSNFIKFHYAVDLAVDHLGKQVLFPDQLNVKPLQVVILDSEDGDEPNVADVPLWKRRKIEWKNKNLNKIQKSAVKNILQGVARPLPYIVFGPPGTGKTLTLVETVLQIFDLIPESRILVATPSNSSANLFTERLIDMGQLTTGSLVRVIAYHIAKFGNISDKLKPFCSTVDVSLETKNIYNNSEKLQSDGITLNSRKSNISRRRITVGTCSCIGSLYKMGLRKGHFTHIVVDEAGQATEPEVMIPLAFIDRFNGQAILAGDPLQLGPVVLSRLASSSGLEESYLERLLNCFPYQKDLHSFRGNYSGYDPRLVTKLINNYRTIPRLLDLPNGMFYDSSLKSEISTKVEWVSEAIENIKEVFECLSGEEFPGLVFHGVRGENRKHMDSPSWYNPHEASMVLLYTNKLYNRDFTPDDIGIITPYTQQIKFLRLLFEDMELESPKIGTVEEFQGQERKIILLSSVRSTLGEVPSDLRHSLGFIKSPKRLNVSITRAQVLLVIFGNPHLLAMDENWCKVIRFALKYRCYMGCDLPAELLLPGAFPAY